MLKSARHAPCTPEAEEGWARQPTARSGSSRLGSGPSGSLRPSGAGILVAVLAPPNGAMKLTSALAERAVCGCRLQALGQGAPEAPRRLQLIAGVLRTHGSTADEPGGRTRALDCLQATGSSASRRHTGVDPGDPTAGSKCRNQADGLLARAGHASSA